MILSHMQQRPGGAQEKQACICLTDRKKGEVVKFTYQLFKVDEIIQECFISFMNKCYIWKLKTTRSNILLGRAQETTKLFRNNAVYDFCLQCFGIMSRIWQGGLKLNLYNIWNGSLGQHSLPRKICNHSEELILTWALSANVLLVRYVFRSKDWAENKWIFISNRDLIFNICIKIPLSQCKWDSQVYIKNIKKWKILVSKARVSEMIRLVETALLMKRKQER